jgi:outer membrane protein OmpA-like peptidoglycan-associated protein
MLSEDDRRKRRRIWLSGTAALLVVAAVGVVRVVQHIPGDIAARTVAALETAGLDPRVTVSVEGRTVILSGQVPDPYTRARMRAIAGSIRGVGSVRDHLAVAPLPAEILQPAERAPHPAPPEKSPSSARPPDAPAASAPPAEVRTEAIALATPDPPPVAAAAEAMPVRPVLAPPAPGALSQPPSETPPPHQGAPPAPSAPEPTGAPLPLLHFEFDSTRLTPDSEPRLQAIVETLHKWPDLRIEVAGHSDAVGSRSYNQRLSLRRARAVADRLVSAGIDGARLQVRGYRESRPLVDNHSRKGRAMNRRVELILIQ